MALLLGACLSEQEKEILGAWTGADDQERIEFMKGGSFVMVEEGMSSKGRYKFVEKDKLEIKMAGPGSMGRPFIVNVSMAHGELVWKIPNGEVRKYFKKK